jgi:AcrR family transcriptional regulator
MSDVCAEAGVSRGTLYRYFKNKEEVLDAIGGHLLASLTHALNDAVAAEPTPHERLRVVWQAMFDYPQRSPQLAMIIHSEPRFALDFFNRVLPQLVTEATQALTPAFQETPPVRDGTATAKDLAELFARLVITTYLMPSSETDLRPSQLGGAWPALPDETTPAPMVTATPR